MINLPISYTLLSISTNLIHYQFPVSMQNHTWVLALALFPFLAKTFFEIISNEWTRAFLTKSMLDNDAHNSLENICYVILFTKRCISKPKTCLKRSQDEYHGFQRHIDFSWIAIIRNRGNLPWKTVRKKLIKEM